MTLELIRWLAHQLHLALLEESRDGQLSANVDALDRLGKPQLEEIGRDLATLVDLDDPGELLEALADARAGQQVAFEVRPGVELLAMPTEGGGLAVLVPPSKAAAGAMQAKAAAADLAAGVSHEVANALSAIVGWAQVARERPDKASPEEALSLIEKSAQVARDATQDLLRMVRNTNHEKSRADLATVLNDVARLLRPEAQQKRVTVHANSDEACWVDAKRSQLFSIVWNLAHNAVQMVPSGGQVRLEVRHRGDLVELEVQDDGPGMSTAQRDKVFEPYYTTRAEGTGLGLAIVRGTVESLGGRIRLDSSPGQGATFRIQLPAVGARRESELIQRTPRISRVMRPEEAERVHMLVVEDDEGVRGLISTALALGGVTSTCVASADKALERKERFSAALIDLTLPDSRGDILLAALRANGTVSTAAIMSGAPPPDDTDPGGQPDRWLRKPFDPSDLMVCVRELTELDLKNAANS